MRASDLPAILDLQDICFPTIEPESERCLAAKLQASPNTCFVAIRDDQLMGYLITHPWTSRLPPELDAPQCHPPADSDSLYLHDLSVHPDARGTGTGQALLDAFYNVFEHSNYRVSTLVAIQKSTSYWERQGYELVPPSHAIDSKLVTYGVDANYMIKRRHD